MSEEVKTQLLMDTIKLFNMMGVNPGVGVDGALMQRIAAELEGSTPPAPRFEIPRGRCPLCFHPDIAACDCDPTLQLAALREMDQVSVK